MFFIWRILLKYLNKCKAAIHKKNYMHFIMYNLKRFILVFQCLFLFSCELSLLDFNIIYYSIRFLKIFMTAFWQLHNYCYNLTRSTFIRYPYETIEVKHLILMDILFGCILNYSSKNNINVLRYCGCFFFFKFNFFY